jgi:hypothetical protein
MVEGDRRREQRERQGRVIPTLTVKQDLSKVLLFYEDLPRQYVDVAAVRALNRTATTVRAEAARRIGREYNIRIGAAKDEMKIRRATRDDLKAALVVSGRPIPLVEFDARQTAAGVSVKVKGTRKVVAHAFLATMKSGHEGVYIREIKGSAKRPGRLPIRQLFSLSLPAAFTQEQIMSALMEIATGRFGDALQQEMHFVMIKNGR